MDYKARFYSPALGRFVQPDSIIPDQSNPQSWNRFSYVLNNPVRYTDPTGHKFIEEDGGIRGCTNLIYCTNGQPNQPSSGGEPDDEYRHKQSKESDPTPQINLCPQDAVWCYERELTESELGAVEARLGNGAFLEGAAALVLGIASGIAGLAALETSSTIIGIQVGALLTVVAATLTIAALIIGFEASQTSEMANYIGDAKEYAKENGTVTMAYYQEPNDLIPSVIYQGDTDGYSYGVTSILGWLNMENLFK